MLGSVLSCAHYFQALATQAKLPGESRSLSEANNSGLQTQQCPTRQVAGIPFRERFDTERTAVVKPKSEYTRKECEMALKYSFKLFFLKCIFEFKINTAPQGSNGVNGREKYFYTINLLW